VSPLARVCRHGEIVHAGGSCPSCQAEKLERSRLRGTTTARGYGSAHRALRKQLAPLVASGQMRCARCGGIILPGTPFDLGHADGDRTRYHGLEHAVCNRGASRLGRRIGAWARERRMTPFAIHLAKRTAWSKKGDGLRYPPVRESRLRAAGSPAFDRARCMNAHLLTPWKRFPNGLEKRGRGRGRARGTAIEVMAREEREAGGGGSGGVVDHFRPRGTSGLTVQSPPPRTTWQRGTGGRSRLPLGGGLGA
jgi:hypothetical protein